MKTEDEHGTALPRGSGADAPQSEIHPGNIGLEYTEQNFNALAAANTALTSELAGATARIDEQRERIEEQARLIRDHAETLAHFREQNRKHVEALEQERVEGQYFREHAQVLERKLERAKGWIDRTIEQDVSYKDPEKIAAPARPVGPVLDDIEPAQEAVDTRGDTDGIGWMHATTARMVDPQEAAAPLLMAWTDDRIARLKELWAEGMITRLIAEELGGVTRNAVIGKAHTLGLPKRRPGKRPGERVPSTRQPRGESMKLKTDATGQRRFEAYKPRGGARRRLPEDHPASVEGRSVFTHTVFHASLLPRLLKSGHNSRKTGSRVAKGRWRSFHIYTLTLEERRTCPRTCAEWATCYGNNMQWAERIIADDAFESRLWTELEALQTRHPAGFVVRLHILGDFYSPGYAALWARALDAFPALHVFGYTARSPFDEIGTVLFTTSMQRWDRFAIRFSNAGFATHCAEVVDLPEQTSNIICPAQTGGTDCCATCGLCWSTPRTIAFLRH